MSVPEQKRGLIRLIVIILYYSYTSLYYKLPWGNLDIREYII